MATYNLEDLNAIPEMQLFLDEPEDDDEESDEFDKRAFCLAPRSRLRSPRIKTKVPLSKPAATKFKSSSIARADSLPML